jgi:hypothetical protein
LYQIFIDNTEINTLAALYVSIYLGIILKYIWTLNVEDAFIGSLTNAADTKIIHPLFLYKKNCCLNGSFILRRIIKHIRRKECSKDDSDEPISSPFHSKLTSIQF